MLPENAACDSGVMESTDEQKLKALVIYYSASDNAKKVADAIHDGLLNEKVKAKPLCG